MPTYSATEVAFLMVASQQAVLGAGWLAGAALMRESRRAALNWALYAALSALSLVLFVVSVKPGIEPVRAGALAKKHLFSASVCRALGDAVGRRRGDRHPGGARRGGRRLDGR